MAKLLVYHFRLNQLKILDSRLHSPTPSSRLLHNRKGSLTGVPLLLIKGALMLHSERSSTKTIETNLHCANK